LNALRSPARAFKTLNNWNTIKVVKAMVCAYLMLPDPTTKRPGRHYAADDKDAEPQLGSPINSDVHFT
jgi:hypothetical protein